MVAKMRLKAGKILQKFVPNRMDKAMILVFREQYFLCP